MVFKVQYCPVSYQGRIQGGFAPPPIFGKVNFIFYIVYNVWKIFLKLNLDFIVAEIRRVFGSIRVYACVCESKSWPFFVLQRPNFEWYLSLFWSQKYMPDCRKSHLIFQNFLGRPPPALGSGFAPLSGPPFPKFLDPPLHTLFKASQNRPTCRV